MMRLLFRSLWTWMKRLYHAIIAKLGGTPAPDDPADDPFEVVDYYGCPNSKKARQLQLSRKPYR